MGRHPDLGAQQLSDIIFFWDQNHEVVFFLRLLTMNYKYRRRAYLAHNLELAGTEIIPASLAVELIQFCSPFILRQAWKKPIIRGHEVGFVNVHIALVIGVLSLLGRPLLLLSINWWIIAFGDLLRLLLVCSKLLLCLVLLEKILSSLLGIFLLLLFHVVSWILLELLK